MIRPSQRQAEIADSRRRILRATIERLAREQPVHRELADQLAAALLILGPDELELVELLATGILLSLGRLEASTSRAPEHPTLVILAAIVSRILRGRASYGELAIDGDPRDYDQERAEELADAVIYQAMQHLRDQRHFGEWRGSPAIAPASLSALGTVGQLVQHSTLAAQARRVLDQERPVPFEIPSPWCLGTALLFQHGAVRIEHDTIVAVRCHQCGREWPLSDTQLRITGSGQYVIPTHEPAPDCRSLRQAIEERGKR